LNFLDFCRAHGVVIDSLPREGAWRRYKTEDKLHHRNGAVKFMGDHGFVQNHATMDEVAVWKDDRTTPVAQNPQAQARMRAKIDAERQRQRKARTDAAELAAKLKNEAGLARHPYLINKGFIDLHGLVLTRGDKQLLMVPMFIEGKIVGCQLIDEDGGKKFLTGQQTKGATFTLGQGVPVYCEGYATALAIQAALGAARMPRAVVVCFSAGNMQHVAKRGFVVADNDASMTGLKATEAIGLPFWISDTVGEDFQDFTARVGLFKASQALKLAWMRKRETVP